MTSQVSVVMVQLVLHWLAVDWCSQHDSVLTVDLMDGMYAGWGGGFVAHTQKLFKEERKYMQLQWTDCSK